MPDVKFEGYHGTTKMNAETIMRQKRFILSNKNTEWLGKGIYFFADYRHAKWWAKLESDKPVSSSDSPAVVTVRIICSDNAFFDFDLPKNMAEMRKQINYTIKRVAECGTGHPEFRTPEERRCFYCNLFQSLNPHLKVFAYTFPRRYRNDLGFDVIDYQRQYCVTDNSYLAIEQMEVLGHVI